MSPDIAAGSTTFSVVVLGCTGFNAHHIDFVSILMALGFPFSAVAHFLLLIPLLHTWFCYSGISVLLKCPLCSTDFPCLRRVFSPGGFSLCHGHCPGSGQLARQRVERKRGPGRGWHDRTADDPRDVLCVGGHGQDRFYESGAYLRARATQGSVRTSAICGLGGISRKHPF